VALLDYLSSFPERRLHNFTLSPFCAPMRLAALAQKPSLRPKLPLQKRPKKVRPLVRRLFRGGWRQTLKFVVFIAENRAHREFLVWTWGVMGILVGR
jgi:hypothetical protein